MINSVSSAAASQASPDALREAFGQFVGEAFYGQLLAAVRTTQGEPAYFHGGQAEKVFQGQLDQLLSQDLAASKAGSRWANALFEQQFAGAGEAQQGVEIGQAADRYRLQQSPVPAVDSFDGEQMLRVRA